MAEIERMTITLPSDMAAIVKAAVEGGDYASSSEVVREALRDWKMKRALRMQELTSLQAAVWLTWPKAACRISTARASSSEDARY
jgi:antitoxin ParD1/3/4